MTGRIGSPGVFQAIELGKPNAWSNPAVIKALGDIQQLAKAGAFQSGYDSLKFSGGGSDALVYSGKAAMQLMGDWDVSSMLGLYDTLFALMLTMSAAAVPLSVLVMVSFVRDIPRELIGAMLVDGGTEWTVFRRLIVPLSTPVLATVAIYDGLDVWNNFILPLVLTQSNSVAVLPLGLTKLEGQYAINVPAVMAAVLLSVLPLVVLFMVMRKQVMRSLGSVVMR